MEKISNLIYKSKNLQNEEKQHILKILKDDEKLEFTKNRNGYFFQLLDASQKVIDEILNYIDLVENNRNLIEESDQKRDYYVSFFKDELEAKMRNKMKTERENYLYSLELRPEFGSSDVYMKKIYKLMEQTDPDLLVANYLKSKTCKKKDNVYYRLSQIMSSLSKRNKIIEQPDQDTFEAPDYACIDDDAEIETEMPLHDAVDEIDVDADVDVEDEDEGGDELSIHSSDDKEYYPIEDDQEDQEDLNLDIDTDQDTKIKTEVMPHELTENAFRKIDFFKNILRKLHGYVFDDDRYIKMQKEKYLEFVEQEQKINE